MNVLLITLDQFRGDCLSAVGHPVVRTPHLDELAAQGVLLPRHYSQAAPCSPGRACLYTGTYQMNNRVVGNGTPLDERFDNHRAARHGGPATTRPSLATPTRASTLERPPVPTIPASRPTRVSSLDSRSAWN